jgi:hypothetical protein
VLVYRLRYRFEIPRVGSHAGIIPIPTSGRSRDNLTR